ncbi:hypothetical protein QBC33DRAFT_554143 [Phialemonium atrogriseum]|uniref:Carboxylic ester hydrolase n=1 Tax=Phialemonium atrogriseum TaxID=1093897 RepID=A0AAJ0C9Y0_9PEZI|nr:uncharacterized protein QBC33DRAFT_554143 [Phialemonium atrogriseum]KAK1772696.1 hypothetical protein QBC33DRAFT_554143 [Phialemonium atrogriseum]
MYPGYDGPRPRMQIWHGSADSTLAPANYQKTIKHVDGRTCSRCSQTPTTSRKNHPQHICQTDDYSDNVMSSTPPAWATASRPT